MTTVVFTADTTDDGRELWVTDGTGPGTGQVADLNPGPDGGVGRVDGARLDGRMYFPRGVELWTTDGTAAGTQAFIETDTDPDTFDNFTGNMAVIGETLYAVTRSGDDDTETLWRTDGSAGNITAVKTLDYLDGAFSGIFQQLTVVGNRLFFVADQTDTGQELWVSDGTEAGTVPLKDIRPGGDDSFIDNMVDVNGTLFFTAFDGLGATNHGLELWKSDGTPTGTVMVKDISPGPSPGNPDHLSNVNGTLFFFASDPTHGEELWKSDGTEAGTVMVKELLVSTIGGQNREITSFNGKAFFALPADNVGIELWMSDGTEAGTTLVKDIVPGFRDSNPQDFIVAGGRLFFTAGSLSGFDRELWVTDGTEAGTQRVKDILPGAGSSGILSIDRIDDKLYFGADDGVAGMEPWVSDGTDAGTGLLKDLAPGSDPSASTLDDGAFEIASVNGNVLLFAQTPYLGKEPERLAAGPSGIELLADLFPGSPDGSGIAFHQLAGLTYFVGRELGGTGLWRTDGTATGTVKVVSASSFGEPTAVGGAFYFLSGTFFNDELWKSDGTQAGTSLVKDIRAGGSSAPANLIDVGGTLFFAADDGVIGRELWKSDGTEAGTVPIQDIRASAGNPDYADFTAFGGTLLFIVDDGVNGRELWKSDGTVGGAAMLKDIAPDNASAFAQGGSADLTVIGNTVYFAASDGTTSGRELWKTDGTSDGTVRVADIAAGSASGLSGSFNRTLTSFNGQLYFAATDTAGGFELWKSDGTETGTVRVKDIAAGGASSNPADLIVVGNTLFFSVEFNADDQGKLWKSDGSEAGTVLVKDFGDDVTLGNFREAGGFLYFSADEGTNGSNGDELWRSDGTEAGTVRMTQASFLNGSFPESFVKISESGVLFRNADTGAVGAANMQGSNLQSWSAATTALGDGWIVGGAGDVLHGGAPEVFVQEIASGTVAFATTDNGPVEYVFAAQNIGEAWKLRAVGDLNGDGRDDAVIQHADTGTIQYVDMANGVGTALRPVNDLLNPDWLTVGAGDVNGDGFADVVVQQQSTGITLYANMANGAFAGWGVVTTSQDVNLAAVAVGDVDGDGFADVVFQTLVAGDTYTAGTTYYADMAGGAFARWGVVSRGLTADYVAGAAQDIDDDGRADVLFQFAGSGQTLFAEVDAAATDLPQWHLVTPNVQGDWTLV